MRQTDWKEAVAVNPKPIRLRRHGLRPLRAAATYGALVYRLLPETRACKLSRGWKAAGT